MASDELKKAISKLKRPPEGNVDLSPRTPFDALLAERIRGLERQVDELKGRVNGFMLLVAGAVIVQVVLNLLGLTA